MDHKHDENNIKQLLSDMPDIKDSRSKETIFSRLKEDERLQSITYQRPKRKKRTNWIPAVIAVSALLVLSILIPSMLTSNKDSQADEMALMSRDKSELTSSSGEESLKDVENNSGTEQQELASDDAEFKINTYEANDQDGTVIDRYAVYPDDIGNNTVFHMGLAGDAAASVPVTFLIPNHQIEEDFGNVTPTSLDLYKKYAAQIDEEALGFNQYHPYKGNLSVEGSAIIQTLPVGHGYDTASGTMATHAGTLQDTFFDFEEVRFKNEDGTILEFDQVGEPSEPLQLTSGKNQFNYYLFKQNDGQEYLSSNFRISYDSIEKALKEMKETNDIYTSVIPQDVDFQVHEDKEITIVKFEKALDLQSMSPKKVAQMIDAMLLTAASFEQQLQFENIVQTEWDGMDLRKPLPIPVGPNSLPFLLK